MLLHLAPDDWGALIVTTLAGWRLARLLHNDRGPFALMVSVRRVLYRLGLGAVLDCFHCGAVWIAIGLAVVVFEPDRRVILLATALAGGISIVERHLEGPGSAEEGTTT